jgi:hypothetical protein
MNAYARGRPSGYGCAADRDRAEQGARNLSSEVPNVSSEVPPDARGAGGD